MLALLYLLVLSSSQHAMAQSVTSITGDGSLIDNSGSTGIVDLTLGDAGAYTLWGNNTSASAVPSYETSPQVSGSLTAQTIDTTGGRSNFVANSEWYAVGVWYKSSDGPAYIGATDSGSPDMLFSNAAGSPIMQLKYSRVVELNGYGAGLLSTDSNGNISAGASSISVDSATGGSEGAGTINVSGGYYVNGSPVTLSSGIFSDGLLLGILPDEPVGDITYCPYKGNLKTTAAYGTYTIPSACLYGYLTASPGIYIGGVAGQYPAATNTLYYVYLINVSGTTYLDLETTGHVTDSATGIEVENGDRTKTLVGMIHTDGNSEVNSATSNTVATWDNREQTYCEASFSANRTTSNTTPTLLNSENTCGFMVWEGDPFIFVSAQQVSDSTAGDTVTTNIYLDGGTGTLVTAGQTQQYSANVENLALPTVTYVPTSEGYHYTTVYGYVGTGTGTWYENQSQQVLTMQ